MPTQDIDYLKTWVNSYTQCSVIIHLFIAKAFMTAQTAIYWCFLWPLTTVLRFADHWTQLLITDSLRYFALSKKLDAMITAIVFTGQQMYWMTCFTSAKNTKLWPFSSAVTTAKQDSLLQGCILEIISLSCKKSYPPMVKKEATPIKQFVNQQR